MSTIKVDTIATRTGSGNITASNTIAGTSATLSGTLGVTGDLTVDTNTLHVDAANNRVGVREASPAAPLHVSTAASTIAEIRLTSNNTGSGSGDRGRIAVYSSRNDGTAYEAGRIDIDRSNGTEDKAHMQFFTNNGSGASERLRILSGGGLTFNGDTAAANALDDYEEGTFTPTFSFTNTNGNHTTSGATGHYVKVGTLVHIQGYIKLATRGTANGVIRIANIPFTNINSGSSYAAGSVWMNTMNSGAPMDGDFMQYMIINPGGDHMRLWCLSGSGSVHEATQGDVQDQSDFMFTITYRNA